MRESLRLRRAFEKAAELMALNGITLDVEATLDDALRNRNTVNIRESESEAVLKFIQKPGSFVKKKCKREICSLEFYTNYSYVDYCCDHCRARALLQIGILWDFHKPRQEQWGGEPPLIVPTEVLPVLRKFAEFLMSQDIPENNPESPEESHPESLQIDPSQNSPAQAFSLDDLEVMSFDLD